MRTYHESMSNSDSMDNYSNFIGNVDDIKSFLVFLGRNRDSDLLTESNFECSLNALGGESDNVQIHRFGHWACGWFEIILIDPNNKTAVEIAENIEGALSDYPVLNDSDYSERQHDAICGYWTDLNLGERIEYCNEANESIFSSRSDCVPELVYDQMADCDTFN